MRDMREVMLTDGEGRCLFKGWVAYDLSEEEMNVIRLMFMMSSDDCEAVTTRIPTVEGQ